MTGVIEIPSLVAGGFAAAASCAKYGDQLLFADEDIAHTYEMTETIHWQLIHVRDSLRSLPTGTVISSELRSMIEALIFRAEKSITEVREYLPIEHADPAKKQTALLHQVTHRAGRAVKWVFCDRNRVGSKFANLQIIHLSLSTASLQLTMLQTTPPTTPTCTVSSEALPSYCETTTTGYTDASMDDFIKYLAMDNGACGITGGMRS